MGGGGNEGFTTTPEGGEEAVTAGLLSYLGFINANGDPTTTYSNDNGTYTISFSEDNLVIVGEGKEQVAANTFVGATLTINMAAAPGEQIDITITN